MSVLDGRELISVNGTQYLVQVPPHAESPWTQNYAFWQALAAQTITDPVNNNVTLGPGANVLSTATQQTAVGAFASVQSRNSTALGFGATASGVSDTALGVDATASGGAGTAVGVLAQTAHSATAVGLSANAQGIAGVAIGYHAITSVNQGDVVIGELATCSSGGGYSTVIGEAATCSSGSLNTAIGQAANASFNFSTAIGQTASCTTSHQVMLGTSAETVVHPGAAQFNGADGTHGGYVTISGTTQTTASMTGATVSLTAAIPAGAVVVGVTARVITAITGATTFGIGDGTTATAFGASIAPALGTTTTNANWTLASVPVYPAGANIVLTANGSNFTAGVVRVEVFYISVNGLTS